MKVCITEHHVAGFGVIPEGSLWDDDSPFVQKSECFADVLDEVRKATRKAGARTVETAAVAPVEER
jgi:hypothetical protein